MNELQFKAIFNSHANSIRNYIYYRSGNKALADDVTQDAFIKLWKKKEQYHTKQIKALLYKIANELFLDTLKKHKIELDYLEHFSFRLKQDAYDTTDNEIYKKKCEIALKVLTEKERTVFLMSKKDQLEYRDIAERLAISVKAVEKRMHNALKKIKQ